MFSINLLDVSKKKSPKGQEIFLFSKTFIPAHPASGECTFPAAKWPEREALHTPASSAEINNQWSYASTPSVCFQGAYNFTFFQCAL